MAVIIRIDVDRPYGKTPLLRHMLSRCSSDFWFPRIEVFGYLRELRKMLQILGDNGARAYIFFRRCTLATDDILELVAAGGHEIGLHLENSKSFEAFQIERTLMERHTGKQVLAFSKHGSGRWKYGRHHFAPYEPQRYLAWAQQAQMKVFFGNLEDPTMQSRFESGGLLYYPAAFWLEPSWRDTANFSVDWLLARARSSDVVLLVHPENVLGDPDLLRDFTRIIAQLQSKIIQ
jgi:hypothetical protein